MSVSMVWAGIAGLSILAVGHSAAGEKMVLGPMFRARGNATLDNALGRSVIRFAWHLTSLMWLLLAALVYFLAFGSEGAQVPAFRIVGVVFGLMGIYAAVMSRGRFVPWVIMLLTGVAFWFASGNGM